jgi:hypothetical protein
MGSPPKQEHARSKRLLDEPRLRLDAALPIRQQPTSQKENDMHQGPSVIRGLVAAFLAVAALAHASTVVAETKVLAKGYTLGGGLTSLVAERIDGRRAIIGKFELDGMVTYFETRRGRRVKPRDKAIDPKYEMDVCFKTSTGQPLIVQYGGDGKLIPGCQEADDATAAFNARSVDDIRGEFLAASTAISALNSVQFRKTFAPEYEALVGHAGIAAEGVNGREPHPDTIEIDEEGNASAMSREARAPTCCPGGYQHYVDVYSAPVAVTFGFARHSAVAAYRILYGTNFFHMAWHRCNHGRCFWQMGGYWWCSMRNRQATRSSHVHNQTCSTGYSWFSTNGNHNCNDDMVMEYSSVRDNMHYSGYSGTCLNQARRDYTPPCW